MFSLKSGVFRLLRVAGIDVFLHWTWFLAALYFLSGRKEQYTSRAWDVAEYVTLFAIVLLHEFGHALACRSVGGKAERIVLWPLGGVAFVSPPARPGALLWSIAAGPLVNLALAMLLFPALLLQNYWGLSSASPDFQHLFKSVTVINLLLLVFNLLPIYPMDGGQVLQALLWFVVGRPWSLIVAGASGVVLATAGAIAALLWLSDPWVGLIGGFIAWRALAGARLGMVLRRFQNAPKREGLACPACKAAPPVGDFWLCAACRTRFDTFQTGATCPRCSTPFAVTACPTCGHAAPFVNWSVGPRDRIGV